MAAPVRVAVVGSGPAGLYAAEELCARARVEVDVVDRLPCPYGLLRYGVAPDHLKMRSLESAFQRTLERPEVRFLGGIEVGADLGAEDLAECYDAVVYATGAASARKLGIDGEDLPGSLPATELVRWYCGHPDAAVEESLFDARTAVVIGLGNVAVDVARVLTKTSAELRDKTDMPEHVLAALDSSAITDVHIVGRRGPAQAKFTPKELRELGELANAEVLVDPAELPPEDAVAPDKGARRNLELLREWAARPREHSKPRRIHLRFLRSPTAVLGSARVEGVVLERNELGEDGRVRGTGETETLPAQLLLRSVGYRGLPVPGVPFDDRAGVIPHDRGRVRRGRPGAAGEYVVGWIKRGPTGVIGTNKSDAKETVGTLVADLGDLGAAPQRACGHDIVELLAARGRCAVTWRGWQAIEAAEKARGGACGRPRVKITDRRALLTVAATADQGG